TMGGFAAFARRYPRRDTLAAPPGLRSGHEVRMFVRLFLWNNLRVLSVETRQNFPFVADKHHSFGLQFLVVRVPLIRGGRFHGTVIPKDVQRRSGCLGGELKANRAGSREGVIVFYPNGDVARTRAKMAGPRFYCEGSVQFEQLEDGPEAVMAHVGQRA